jgi:hypothetical protein
MKRKELDAPGLVKLGEPDAGNTGRRSYSRANMVGGAVECGE